MNYCLKIIVIGSNKDFGFVKVKFSCENLLWIFYYGGRLFIILFFCEIDLFFKLNLVLRER